MAFFPRHLTGIAAVLAMMGCQPTPNEPTAHGRSLRTQDFNSVRPAGVTATARVTFLPSPPTAVAPQGAAWYVELELTNTADTTVMLDILGGNCMYRIALYAAPPGAGGRVLWPGITPDEICEQPLQRLIIPPRATRVFDGYTMAQQAIDRAKGLQTAYPRVIVEYVPTDAFLHIDAPLVTLR